MTAPLGYFLEIHGAAAQPSLLLGWVFAAICVAVCLIIGVWLWVAIVQRRSRAAARSIMSGGPGLRWVGIASFVSTAILVAMGVYALIALNRSATPPTKPAFTITVTGYDWWWQAVYENADPALRFAVANEIHIPVGVPVAVELKSADVIHAFWVPQLAGKTQMIPGLTNRQWLQADMPGRYRGQCTQFCGAQHAHMAFEVVAQTPAAFAAWQAAQRQPQLATLTGDAAAGQQLFQQQCAACHTVRGTRATGEHGPDLTHLNSRGLLAAGMLPNTPDQQMRWVTQAQALKPGARMPSIPLTSPQQKALSAYLQTLN